MAESQSDVCDSKFSFLYIYIFQNFSMHKFVIPEDFPGIERSVSASLVDSKIRQPPGGSERVGDYAVESSKCVLHEPKISKEHGEFNNLKGQYRKTK